MWKTTYKAALVNSQWIWALETRSVVGWKNYLCMGVFLLFFIMHCCLYDSAYSPVCLDTFSQPLSLWDGLTFHPALFRKFLPHHIRNLLISWVRLRDFIYNNVLSSLLGFRELGNVLVCSGCRNGIL